jgi:hypothetical protein
MASWRNPAPPSPLFSRKTHLVRVNVTSFVNSAPPRVLREDRVENRQGKAADPRSAVNATAGAGGDVVRDDTISYRRTGDRGFDSGTVDGGAVRDRQALDHAAEDVHHRDDPVEPLRVDDGLGCSRHTAQSAGVIHGQPSLVVGPGQDVYRVGARRRRERGGDRGRGVGRHDEDGRAGDRGRPQRNAEDESE